MRRPRLRRRAPGALFLGACALVAAAELTAQEEAAAPSTLTLDEAISLARLNNPGFRSTRNAAASADWGVRRSYAALLPTATGNVSGAYEGAGVQTFGALVSTGSTDYLRSSYSLNAGYTLSGATFSGIASARADRRATEAGIAAAGFTLESAVTQQYLAALRARDAVRVAEQQLQRARENEELTRVRVQAGVALSTDGKQAEVDRGRAEVARLRAESDLRAEKLRLMEAIGLRFEGDFTLSSEFEVGEPELNGDALLEQALDAHPQLRSLRAAEAARGADVWNARSSFLPSLNVFAQWSGFTRQARDESFLVARRQEQAEAQMENCEFWNTVAAGLSGPLPGYPQDCSRHAFTPSIERDIIQGNSVWPWDFTKQPFFLQATVSLPIFQGFQRKLQVEQARLQADNARESRRAEELRLHTAVTQAVDALTTAYRVVEIEERNLTVAGEQEALARERYRLGAAPYLELLQAQESLAAAERDALNARYDYLQAVSDLEAAAGTRILRGAR